MNAHSEYEQLYAYWRAQYNTWITDADRVPIAQLTDRMMPFDLAYGQGGQRAAAVAHFAWLLCPPEQREQTAYLSAHLLLWLYGIDGLLDTCDDMLPAYDLHRLSVFAAHHPDKPLNTEVFRKLLLRTDVTSLYPNASCSILALGLGVQQLINDIRSFFPHNEAEVALFIDEFDFEVWAEVTESLWRLSADWYERTLDDYLKLGGASIAAIATSAIVLTAISNSATQWESLRPAIWQTAVVCRLANDIATLERDREEQRANAIFLTDNDEEIAREKVYVVLVAAIKQLPYELALLPVNPTTDALNFILTRMVGLTLIMYNQGADFTPPGS